MTDRVGYQLGNYRLLTLLGKGSFAEVYLGQHVRFKQQAAIKVLHTHLTGTEAEHFQREAETISALAHPGIVRVFDFDLDIEEGMPFLVMEYAPNGSLRRRHPREKWSRSLCSSPTSNRWPTPCSMRTSTRSSTVMSSRRICCWECAKRLYWLLGTSVQKYAPLREKILLTLLANIGGLV
jgi:serine/threonine protein kinase